jgi:hypothetical protein
MLTVIVFALLGAFSFTIYSRKFAKISENTDNHILTALIMYFFAALILFSGTAAATLFWRDSFKNFVLPPTTQLWARNLGLSNSIGVDIALSILVMSVGYAVSIIAETRSRKEINIGSFDIASQLNSAVVVALTAFVSTQPLAKSELWGGILVIIASVLPLISKVLTDKTLSKGATLWTIASGVFCGIALVTDSNITKQIIYYPTFTAERTPLFICYEANTFFLPFLIGATYYLFRFGTKNLKRDIAIENKQQKDYWIAALFSALYFVFGVFAFAADTSLIAPDIFAAIPIINVYFDPKERTETHKRVEYVSSVLVFLGLLLIAQIIKI